MIEKGKISSFQMAILMYPVVVATGDLWVPATTAKYAERNLWMIPLLSSLAGILIIFIAYQLHKLYPNKTLIQYSEQILGRFLGKFISLIYLFYYIKSIGLMGRQYAEFIAGTFLPRTPRVVVIGSLIFVCAVAVRLGIEVIARSAQIFVPLVILGWVIIVILLIPDMEINHMFPILEEGITPIIKGSIHFSNWMLHFTILIFLLPLLSDQKNAVKWGVISLIIITLTLSVLDLVTLFILGELTPFQTYPIMSVIKYIEVADFMEHLESIVMAIWVLGAFIKTSVYYYIFALGISQFTGLSEYRPIVFPLSISVVSFCFWLGPTLADISHYLDTTNLFFNYTAKLLLPLLLLIVACIKKKRQIL